MGFSIFSSGGHYVKQSRTILAIFGKVAPGDHLHKIILK